MSLSAADLNGHTGDNEIGTPDDLFAWLNRRFQFGYDAAASHDNHLLPMYSTVDGTFAVTSLAAVGGGADVLPISTASGLQYSWGGGRVFCNPPYGRGIYTDFINKAIIESPSAEVIVLLGKYDSSTANGKLLRDNFHLEYLSRIKYKGMTTAAPFASVLAISKGAWK